MTFFHLTKQGFVIGTANNEVLYFNSFQDCLATLLRLDDIKVTEVHLDNIKSKKFNVVSNDEVSVYTKVS